ncbi:MAG: hypothetical protein ACK41C_00150 [Phenylobacterium sp.]
MAFLSQAERLSTRRRPISVNWDVVFLLAANALAWAIIVKLVARFS